MLEDLHDLAVNKPRQFGPLFWGLDRDEISMQIAKVRATLPTELKQAVQTVRDSERIVDSAREDAHMTVESARKESERLISEANLEAQRILDHAKIQQERMLSESEILKLSKAQSEEIRNAAERDAVQMRRGAEKYAYDVLSQLEGVVGKVINTIDRGKAELRPSEPTAIASVREKVKV